jgi:carboxyl-terminal processing protease
VGQVADSLKSAFTTAGGRVVYDGGGVDPDLSVDTFDYAPVTTSLLDNNLLFYYATEYYYSHETIADPRDFQLTDQEYESFVAWVKAKNFTYQTGLEEQLQKLQEVAKSDVQFEVVKPAIKALEAKIAETKKRDLEVYRPQIQVLLEQEIASRYYLERGMIEATFNKDPDILKAVDVLSNMVEYNRILKK